MTRQRADTPYALRPLAPPGPGTPLFENHRLYLGAHVWHNDLTEAWLAQISPAEAQDRQVQYESDWYEVYTSSEGTEVFKDHVMGLNEVCEVFLKKGESAEEFVGRGFGARMEVFVGVFLSVQARGHGDKECGRGIQDGDECVKRESGEMSRKRERSCAYDEEEDGDTEYRVGEEEESSDDDDEVSKVSEEDRGKRRKERRHRKLIAKLRASKRSGKAAPTGHEALAHLDPIDACNPWADQDGDDEEVLASVKREAEDDQRSRLELDAAAATMPADSFGLRDMTKTIRAAKAKPSSGLPATIGKSSVSQKKPASRRKSKPDSKKKKKFCAPPLAEHVKCSSSANSVSRGASTSKDVPSSTDDPSSLSMDLNATAALLRTALTTLCATKPTSLTSTSTFLTALGALSLASTAPAITTAARSVLGCFLGALDTTLEACRREEGARREAASRDVRAEILAAHERLAEVYREERKVLVKEWEDWDEALGELEEAIKREGK